MPIMPSIPVTKAAPEKNAVITASNEEIKLLRSIEHEIIKIGFWVMIVGVAVVLGSAVAGCLFLWGLIHG